MFDRAPQQGWLVWLVVTAISAGCALLAIAIWPRSMLSSTSSSIVTWLGFLAGLLALPPAFWGLSIAIKEAAEARRKAVEASSAAHAASDAVASLKVYIDTANVAYASAQLNVLHHAIVSGQFHTAYALLLPLRRTLELKAGPKGEQNTPLYRALGTLEKHLQYGIAGSADYRERAALKAVGGILHFATMWEAALQMDNKNRSLANALA